MTHPLPPDPARLTSVLDSFLAVHASHYPTREQLVWDRDAQTWTLRDKHERVWRDEPPVIDIEDQSTILTLAIPHGNVCHDCEGGPNLHVITYDAASTLRRYCVGLPDPRIIAGGWGADGQRIKHWAAGDSSCRAARVSYWTGEDGKLDVSYGEPMTTLAALKARWCHRCNGTGSDAWARAELAELTGGDRWRARILSGGKRPDCYRYTATEHLHAWYHLHANERRAART